MTWKNSTQLQSKLDPRLPDGSSMGPMPGELQERFAGLYQKFADAWRVTNESSLFDYEPGTTTENFTLRNWPPKDSNCSMPQERMRGLPRLKPVKSLSQPIAEKACLAITDEHARRNCIYDVKVTGNTEFAKSYRRSQCAVTTTTRTTLTPGALAETMEPSFTASVAQARAGAKNVPTGSVQFIVDGQKFGKPVRLDANGQAVWKAKDLRIGKHKVSASYIPDKRKKFSPSLSAVKEHSVDKN